MTEAEFCSSQAIGHIVLHYRKMLASADGDVEEDPIIRFIKCYMC